MHNQHNKHPEMNQSAQIVPSASVRRPVRDDAQMVPHNIPCAANVADEVHNQVLTLAAADDARHLF